VPTYSSIMQRSSTSIVGGPLVHPGPKCGTRRVCWRAACRVAFGPYAMVETLPYEVIARCHRQRYALDDPLLRRELDGEGLAA
jgi:hypothetical protein